MSKRKKNYYAVKIGRNTGIYSSWEECHEQVKGFSGCQYKGFSTKKEAEAYMTEEDLASDAKIEPEQLITYVDGSYDSASKVYGYGCVVINPVGEVKVFCKAGDNEQSAALHNVAGEMLGAMFAVKYAIKMGYKSVVIYYDYLGIARWANGDWKAKNELTQKYAVFMEECKDKIDISFQKVVAHTNNKYNDIADSAAKTAVSRLVKDMQNKEVK